MGGKSRKSGIIFKKIKNQHGAQKFPGKKGFSVAAQPKKKKIPRINFSLIIPEWGKPGKEGKRERQRRLKGFSFPGGAGSDPKWAKLGMWCWKRNPLSLSNQDDPKIPKFLGRACGF